MTSPRTPRQWNAGDPEPEDRPVLRDHAPGAGFVWETPLQREGIWGNDYGQWMPWAKVLEHYGPLSEVLPETPEPTQVGDRVIATQFGRAHETVEGVLEAPASPVDEPATVRRDDGIRIYILNVVKVVQARGHRGGCLGCEHDPAAYPPCWSEDEIDDDQSRRADWIRGTTRVPASQSVPAVPVSSTGGTETKAAAETATEALRALVGHRMRGVLGDDEIDDLVDALAGWRPPLPKHDLRMMRSLLAGIIDGHFGDDHRETATAAAEEIIGRGWLDKVADVGPPEPVATTLRRIIRDLEDQAAGPQRHTHSGIALSQYADRLRGHPALDADADAGWPPLPDSETEPGAMQWGYREHPDEVVDPVREEYARFRAQDEHLKLVQREVRFGPWIEVTS